jgi:hypothetical protein
VKTAAKAAEVHKRIYPHLFRHSAATRDAHYLNEAELRIKYGWEKSSDMPSTYVHLAARDVDEKLISIYSGKVVKLRGPDFVPLICARCSEKCSPGMKFCSRCGTPLGQSDVVRSSLELESMKEKIKQMQELIKSSMNRQSASLTSQEFQAAPLITLNSNRNSALL